MEEKLEKNTKKKRVRNFFPWTMMLSFYDLILKPDSRFREKRVNRESLSLRSASLLVLNSVKFYPKHEYVIPFKIGQ